ncbi:serine/arginine repetitive matrix protein 5-like [Seriola lalandi dorsalis]|uniref:Serine/arginine repetitive matrix protein 5-like n=1 Tax=Seriola lalandi dorsalis TaxID=1841481 RepID=A0A3B4WSF8_SERLL|nr:serine/arginine repetitive matrix protein 5-like [Seriola lalandi dorsalis]XP_023278509.1 serine/arginine repetitive matrix protein 5-like [Seriola lalandi dorsalis]XP_023278510.1 serine/arginine repetitive matrix protein 5-like [Seriola lalandi dorsalis]XP_023278512.1 serine/arginine repetitive matrix protein 5-like [Seriola lalandi dorsalis]
MDHARPQDTPQSKGSMLRHRECSDESVDKRPTDSSLAPPQDEKRPIRRVRSPSRPRAWQSSSYKPKFGGRFYRPRFPRDDHPFHKPGFGNQRYHHFNPRAYLDRRDHFHPKLPRIALKEREWEKEKEKERYERREGADGNSPPKQNNATRPFLPRSTSSRDKDMQFTVCQNDRNQSRERDHRGTKSKEREQGRDGELPLTASQMAARDRAIQQKRREIDEVYYQECEMFGLVTKMLIAKDPSLEHPIQSSLQENLRDIGKRCVEAMEKFIEDYDSRELVH